MLSCMFFSSGQNESFNVRERERKRRDTIESIEHDFQEAETAIQKKVATQNRQTREIAKSVERIT